MDWITVHAKTLDEAISKAAMELNTPSYNLEYQVKQEASAGIFGLFGKDCIIEARKKPVLQETSESKKAVKAEVPKQEKKPEPKKSEKPAEKKQEAPSKKEEPVKKAENAPKHEKKEEASEKKPERDGQKKNRQRGEKQEGRKDKEGGRGSRNRRPEKNQEKQEAAVTVKEVPEKPVVEVKPMTQEEKEGCEKAALEFLKQVFEAMDIQVELNVVIKGEDRELTVEMAGEDMGVLIGKRGQTLDSLQYLVSLVVNKVCGDYVRVKLDTENYRARRKDTLESLARNIAYRVKRSRKNISLEPMNPYERRIIHAALQNDKYVTTRSEGEDPFRHVVITLKREPRNDRRDSRRNPKRSFVKEGKAPVQAVAEEQE